MKIHLFLYLLLAIISFNCSKNDSITPTNPPTLPTITTTAATSVNVTSVGSGGNVSSDGGATVTVRGVCWGITTNPIVTGNHTSDGTGPGAFSSNITGLNPATTYYVRAYASNSVGTAYGNEINVTTLASPPVLPTLTTTAITSITSSSAVSGANISADGGSPVTARGVCWSNTTNPLATGNHTSDGTGTGVFISAIISLTPNTTYYVRSYATNSVGTAYGNELSFTTATPDVYISGWENNGTKDVAKVWKNGIATSLTDGTNNSRANSVYASGTDVYVAGYENNASALGVAKTWKNGVATSLTNGVNSAQAWSILDRKSVV